MNELESEFIGPVEMFGMYIYSSRDLLFILFLTLRILLDSLFLVFGVIHGRYRNIWQHTR